MPVAATVPMVVVPEPPAVAVHVVVMEVEVTVVAVPVAVAVGIRVTRRRQCGRAERDRGGEGEHCSASEHGRSFLELRGLSIRTIGRETVALRSSR